MPALGDVFWGNATGRFRSINLGAEGTGSNAVHLRPSSFNPVTGEIDPGAQEAVKAMGAVICPGPDPLNPPLLEFLSGTARGMGWQAKVRNGIGASDLDDHRNDFISPPAGVGDHTDVSNCEWTASFSISRVEEYFLLYFLNTGVAGANGDPNWGGASVGDVNPRAIGIFFYEVVPEGALISASMDVVAPYGSASASCSSYNPAPWTMTYGATLNLTPEGASTIGLTAFVTGTFLGDWQYCGPASTVSWSNAYLTLTATGPSLSLTAIGPLASDHFINGALYAEPDRQYRVHGHLYAWDQDYPSSVHLNLYGSPTGQPQNVVLNPTGTADFDQRVWSVDYVADGVGPVHLDGRNEWEAIRSALNTSDLTGLGEDPHDWVTMFSGKRYGALRVKHDATHAEPTPASIGGGVWKHDYPAFPVSGNWEGYGFLRVVLKTDAAGEDVTILAAGRPAKTYRVTTTGTGYTTFDIDLLAPVTNDATDDPDLWDDRNPLTADGLPLKDPSAWGIGAIESLTLSGGTNLVVQSVALVRKDAAAKMSAIPAFLDWSLVQNDESYHYGGVIGSVPIVQSNRCVVIDVDGRRSIVEPCSLRQLMSDGSGGLLWVYAGRNARNLETTLNACPGFTCDETPYTATDGWHALDGSEGSNYIDGGPIYYAGWSGFQATGSASYNGTAAVNELGTTVADSYKTLTYQPRYHEIIGYPGMGDCWGDSGGATGRTPLRVVKVLRAAADGVALDIDGTPIASATATLKDGFGTTVSTATTDTRGRYRMASLPYGKGQKDHTVTLGSAVGSFAGTWDDGQGLGADDATQERFNARRMHRAAFRPIVRSEGRILAFLSRGDGSLFRIVDRDGTAHLGHSDVPRRQIWDDLTLSRPATEASLEKGKGERRVFGLLDSGTLTLYIDASEGRDGPTHTMTEGSATSHDVCSFGDGALAILRIDGGAVKITLRNARDLSLIAGPYTTNVTGLPDDATIRGDDARLSGNTPILAVVIGRGSTTDTYITKDLKTLVA